MFTQNTATYVDVTLTRSEALDLIYAVIESTQEFMGEYHCNESERLCGALRLVFRLIEAITTPTIAQ